MASRSETKFERNSSNRESLSAAVEGLHAQIIKHFEDIGVHFEASQRRLRLWLTIVILVTSFGGFVLQKFFL